jgi:hypothetical protein
VSRGATGVGLFPFRAPLTPGPFRLLFDYTSNGNALDLSQYAPLPQQLVSSVVAAGVTITSGSPSSTTYDGSAPIQLVLTPSTVLAVGYTITTVSAERERERGDTQADDETSETEKERSGGGGASGAKEGLRAR